MATSDSTSKPVPCSVYVIQAQSAVKIGIARNVLTRLKELQTGNHEKLKVAYAHVFRRAVTAQAVETFLHHHFKAHRLQGEWFSVSAAEVKTELQLVLNLCDVIWDDDEDAADDEELDISPSGEAIVVKRFPKFDRPVDLANAIVDFARQQGAVSKTSIQGKFGLDEHHTHQLLLQLIKFRVIQPPTQGDDKCLFIASDDFHFVEKGE